INVNEDTIGLDTIKKVATERKPGANFLGEKHTREHMKNELYIPKLIDRNRRTTWRKKGSKDIITTAREKVDQILQNYIPPEIPVEIETQLQDYIKKVETRSLEYYKNAEGISASSISIVGTEIKIDEK
ncbi:unnamed protein product, partial [marine sediment metagenome]